MYPGNAHGPADEVVISQDAVIRGKLLFVDEDEAVVLYSVTVSTVNHGRTRRKTGDVAVDATGNVYFTDANGGAVRVIHPNGIIATAAGTGIRGFSGDNGPAVKAQLNFAEGLAVDRSGSLYISDRNNNRIRKVSADGTITTFAGTGVSGHTGDGGPATLPQLAGVTGIGFDLAGNLYLSESGDRRIREIGADGTIETLAGSGMSGGFSGDGGPALQATFFSIGGIAVDSSGDIFIADAGRIRRISGGTITSVAGDGDFIYSGDRGPATLAQFSSPGKIAVDSAGNVFIPDYGNNRVRKVTPDGTVTTVAGNGTPGDTGDGGSATSAALFGPSAVAVDPAGNLYIALQLGHTVRKVSKDGVISTIAASNNVININDPEDVVADANGNVYFADSSGIIRIVQPSGTITSLPGPPAQAQAFFPVAFAAGAAGDMFVLDAGNGLVYRYDAKGSITIVVDSSAKLVIPSAIAVDNAGNLFIAEAWDVRKVTAGGTITTIAGSAHGYSGDGGPASGASIGNPSGLAIDSAGHVFIADSDNNAIRVLTPTSPSVIVSAVDDAASESSIPVAPGKIIVIYGAGPGPATVAVAGPSGGAFPKQCAGTTVTVNGIPAAMIYSYATQVAAIVPYGTMGTTAQVNVSYQGQTSAAFGVPIAVAAPSLFSLNGTGEGEAASVNADGTINDAAHPVKVGGYISLYATGEGQTSPAGMDGALANTQPFPAPNLPVSVTVGGISVTPVYAGAAPTEVAGLMQIVFAIPSGVQPGGYVPVEVTAGNASTVGGAAWIAVSAQ
jgi:uncharacterized protein (TIGR03437 family)